MTPWVRGAVRPHWACLFALILGCSGKGRGTSNTMAAANDFTGGAFVEVEIDIGMEVEDLEELDLIEINRATAECGDLLKLEPSAMLGQLSDAEIRCLDRGLRTAERQTAKDKISRVLLTDAWAKGDEHRWEGMARRHLEVIDRSDPDICYKFAYYLLSRSPDKMDEAMMWAQVALDNRARWEGEQYVSRVFSLHKIRTRAANKKWSWLESEYSRHPSSEALDAANEARNETKTVAREWLDYTREAGKDQTQPLAMCMTASGTEDYCLDER